MSTGTASPQFDQFSESSTVVGVDKTREEYSKLFSRATYSPLCDRPYSSPISGSYDATNTSTRLVLLNYRFKNSHLREQIVPEELSNPSQRDFEYESIFIPEKPKPKPKAKPKRHSTQIAIDPYRHFESILLFISALLSFLPILIQGQTKYWHNRRCTSSCLADNLTDISHPEPTAPTPPRTIQKPIQRSLSVNIHRPPSALAKKDKYQDEPETFNASFCQHYRDTSGKSDPTEFALPQYSIKEPFNQRLKSGGTRRKLPLTKGQQLYLIGKYNTYDVKDITVRRTNSYAQTLSNRYKADHHCKPQFRLNDHCDYFKYSKFLQLPPSKSPEPKKPMVNSDSQKSFTVHSSRPPISIRFRQDSKSIPTELKVFI